MSKIKLDFKDKKGYIYICRDEVLHGCPNSEELDE
jgi:hypothetical protein